MRHEITIKVYFSEEDDGFISKATKPKEFLGLSAYGPTIEDSLDEFVNAYLLFQPEVDKKR